MERELSLLRKFPVSSVRLYKYTLLSLFFCTQTHNKHIACHSPLLQLCPAHHPATLLGYGPDLNHNELQQQLHSLHTFYLHSYSHHKHTAIQGTELFTLEVQSSAVVTEAQSLGPH